jgi:hypothetical protein
VRNQQHAWRGRYNDKGKGKREVERGRQRTSEGHSELAVKEGRKEEVDRCEEKRPDPKPRRCRRGKKDNGRRSFTYIDSSVKAVAMSDSFCSMTSSGGSFSVPSFLSSLALSSSSRDFFSNAFFILK